VCGPPICSRSLVPSRELPREPGKPPQVTSAEQRRITTVHLSAISHAVAPSPPSLLPFPSTVGTPKSHPPLEFAAVANRLSSSVPHTGSTTAKLLRGPSFLQPRPPTSDASRDPFRVRANCHRPNSALSPVEWSRHEQQLVAPSPTLPLPLSLPTPAPAHCLLHHGQYRPLPPAWARQLPVARPAAVQWLPEPAAHAAASAEWRPVRAHVRPQQQSSHAPAAAHASNLGSQWQLHDAAAATPPASCAATHALVLIPAHDIGLFAVAHALHRRRPHKRPRAWRPAGHGNAARVHVPPSPSACEPRARARARCRPARSSRCPAYPPWQTRACCR
jgi:hypothetical protein